jgi:thiol-disulfide isomerase/thioredoxin
METKINLMPLIFINFRKRFLCIISMVMVLLSQHGYAQMEFDIKISLDSSINPKGVVFFYNNGIKDIFVSDTFHNHNIEIKKSFYSESASFGIRYNHDGKTAFSNAFFVNEMPASISFFYDKKDAAELKYQSAKNASPIFDSNANHLFGELLKFRRKEAGALDEFFAANGYPPYKNDSVKSSFEKIYMVFDKRTIAYLKEHADSYFSVWFYINQVVPPSMNLLGIDSAHLGYLLKTFSTVFPEKYTNSPGGKYLINNLNGLIRPYRINQMSPSFTAKNMNSQTVKIKDYKEKYVLLDFWATWCGPCMQAIPFIRKLRNDYSTDKLEIISISQDRDSIALKNVIATKEMKWENIWDQEEVITHLFGISGIPTTILINKDGLIIYRCTGITPENENEIYGLIK